MQPRAARPLLARPADYRAIAIEQGDQSGDQARRQGDIAAPAVFGLPQDRAAADEVDITLFEPQRLAHTRAAHKQ
jgi:hypothetical protein